MPCIGIDFGTTASKMAWFDPRAGQAQVLVNAEGELRTPSVVYVGNDGLLVGGQAEQMFQFAEERKRVVLSIKRNLVQTPQLYLANRPIRALDIAAAILHKLKTDAEELYFHQPVRQAVITYPASFNVLQRDKIAEAGRLAGFEQVAMLAEPIAAALAYAHAGLTVGNRLLVYDLGGGTFDVALLAREDGSWRLAMPAKGLNYCGGDDFDRSLYTFCDERALAEVGGRISDGDQLDLAFLRLCRQRKETLSTQSKATFSTLVTVNGWETRFEQVIDRPTFNGLIGDRVRATVTLTQETMADPAAGSVDTVVLVGGSSRVPLVEELLTVALQKPPLKWGNRDHAVALGAAYHAQTLWADSGPVNGREQEAPPPTSVPAPRPPVERTPAPQPAPQPATTTVVAPERPPPALSNQDLSNQALSAAQAGNLPEAERLLTQLLERDPPHFDAATRLAAIRQQRAGPPQPPPAPQPTPRGSGARATLISVITIILLFIPYLPVGLFVMWKYADWSKTAKWVVTGFYVAYILIVLAGALSGSSGSTGTSGT